MVRAAPETSDSVRWMPLELTSNIHERARVTGKPPSVRATRMFIEFSGARVPDLNGQVIGMLDISKPKGNLFLDRLAERLTEQFQPRDIIRRMKPTFARPAPEEVRKELEQKCDLIIEALAD